MAKHALGFIGLGNMGKPMARNLIGGESEAWVYDLMPAPVQELAALGALAASSPADLAARCGLIGICVRDDNDVANLLYGNEGILAHAAAGTTIAIHSTVTHAALLGWAADARARGIELLDAPVTRGRNSGNMQGRFLCFMIGGEAGALERCRPLFEPSAEEVVHAGPLGSGITLKLCNNLMTYLEFIAIGEAALLAERAGLSFEVLARVGRANGVVNERMEAFAGNRSELKAQLDETRFAAAYGSFGTLGEKDLDAAIASARALGLHLRATEHAREIILDTFLCRGHEA